MSNINTNVSNKVAGADKDGGLWILDLGLKRYTGIHDLLNCWPGDHNASALRANRVRLLCNDSTEKPTQTLP